MSPGPLSRFIAPGTDPDVVTSYEALPERALEESFGFEERLAYVDIETTGFDPRGDRIIEVAAVVARGPEALDRYSTLVDPGFPIPRETTRLTGIDDAMVAGRPDQDEAVARLAEVVAGCDVVAHNVRFDRSFLEVAAGRAGVSFGGGWLDSLHLATIGLPRLRSHRLIDLAQAFDLSPADHRAAHDAEAVFRVWRIALCALMDLPAEALTTLSMLSPATHWPTRAVLAHLAAARRSGGADLRALRTTRGKRGLGPILPDAREVELTFPSRDDVLAEFSPGGAVRRMYEGFEAREEQARMTEAVLEAFETGRHLAVEAGTGVGKSVAYLVPAVRFARENGVAVGVSTKTNALMDQLVHQELPALAAQLDGGLAFVALKGYEHYPCLRKLDRHLATMEDADAGTLAATCGLVSWVAQSSWGDFHSVNVHLTRDLRRAVTATSQECTKKRCRFYPDLCYLHGVRRRAACADIVVTNHSLLFNNVMAEGGILPPVRHWIVDEAHAAEGAARDQLSVRVDHAGLMVALKALAAKKGTPLQGLRGLAAEIADDEEARGIEGAADAIRDGAATCLTIAGSFFEYVKDLDTREEAEYERREMRITDTMRDSARWGRVAGTGRSLARHLAELLGNGERLLRLLEELGVRPTDDRADVSGQIAGVHEHLLGLASVLDGTDEAYVYSATVDRRRDVAADRLDARLIDVGEALAERFFPETRTVVLTSATIAAGEDFSHLERALGLDRLPAEGHETLRLASSYDFERQMAAYVTADAPEPGSRRYFEEMGALLFEVHRAMGGSVLTLFTNRRDLERLYANVGERLEAEGLRLVGQVRGESTKRIRDEFVGDERASLFATKSFWEGFDAKGDTLRCVVVVRLPFAHPGEPLLEEIKERDPPGWWSEHYLPRAILELKQAAGRLIRSSTDEGCLVIADSRVAGKKPYGPKFLAALPVRDVRVATTDEVVADIARRFERT